MTKIDQLVAEIVAFCMVKCLSEREFSELAMGGPKSLARLRRGNTTGRTIIAADRFMLAHASTPPYLLRQMLEARRAKPAPIDPEPVRAAA